MASPIYNTTEKEKYPGLIDKVIAAVQGYGGEFKDDLSYAFVDVDFSIDKADGIRKHIDWFLQKEGTGDVNVRNVKEYYTYKLIPLPPEEETIFITELGGLELPEPPAKDEPVVSDPPKVTEDDFKEVKLPRLPIISLSDRIIEPIPILSPRIPIGGEGAFGSPQLGSSTSRGGVLGGRNYSNPQDAIDNEFRFRTRVLTREL